MKYKYKLTERNESDTQDALREKNNLTLTAKGNYNLKQILDILQNPKPEYLKGVYVPFSENEKEIKLNVYGEKNILANVDKNKTLKANQKEKYGKLFYEYIQDVLATNGQSVKFERIITDPVGGFILGLPLMTKNNNDIITKYINLTKNKGKKSSGLKWEELPGEAAVRFLTDNMSITEKTVKTILSNAGLESGEDYSLKKEKTINEIQVTRPKISLKLVKKAKDNYGWAKYIHNNKTLPFIYSTEFNSLRTEPSDEDNPEFINTLNLLKSYNIPYYKNYNSIADGFDLDIPNFLKYFMLINTFAPISENKLKNIIKEIITNERLSFKKRF